MFGYTGSKGVLKMDLGRIYTFKSNHSVKVPCSHRNKYDCMKSGKELYPREVFEEEQCIKDQ